MNTPPPEASPLGAAPLARFNDPLLEAPWIGLVYLVFVFLPLMFMPDFSLRALLLSLLACGVFVPAYFASYRPRGHLWPALASAAIGYALIPFNPGGNTFIIYAMVMLAHRLTPGRLIAASSLLLALMAAELLVLVDHVASALGYVAVVALIGSMVSASTLYSRVQQRRMAELRLSQDEVRRLATVAERERIARDLHDLLGHTLSVVVLKSELAGKLVERDPQAARAQIGEVEQVARQALREVREAVSGFRSLGLQAELAAARLALLGAEVELEVQLDELPLRAEVDAALALCLREAVTNVLRHAGARTLSVSLRDAGGRLQLRLADDGRGGAIREGNGLQGMRERLAALGGELQISPASERGTALQIELSAGWRAEAAA